MNGSTTRTTRGESLNEAYLRLFAPWALPAAFVSLSSHFFRESYPAASAWIGQVCLALLAVSSVVALVRYALRMTVPRRFANEIFVVDREMNLAVIEHPHHKRFVPPGSRLGYHEPPHEAIARVLRDELGLDERDVTLWPPVSGIRKYKDVELVPAPFQVQMERHPQRLGVQEHCDFIYVGRVSDTRPTLRSPLHPRWMSLEELQAPPQGRIARTFPDVVPTLRRIISAMQEAEVGSVARQAV